MNPINERYVSSWHFVALRPHDPPSVLIDHASLLFQRIPDGD